MNEAFARALAALELALRLSLPLLALAFAVGVAAALLSVLLRLTEPTLSTLPRALLTLLVLAGSGAWMGRELLSYTGELFRALPALVH